MRRGREGKLELPKPGGKARKKEVVERDGIRD